MVLPPRPLKPTPKTAPKPAPKGPWEKRGSIPREKLPYLFEKGPYSLPYSRGKGRIPLRQMGRELAKKFPSFYGREISGKEIEREISRIKRFDLPRAKTQSEKNKIRETIARWEEAKKRAGL